MGKNKKAYITFSVLILCLCLLPSIALCLGTQTSGFYSYEIENGAAVITGYKGSETAITLPSTLDGIPVTKIGPHVFGRRRDLTKITLPEGLTAMDTGVLRDTGISEITLPASLDTIGDYAFQYCRYLKTISVPEGNQAFKSQDGVLYSKDMSKLIAYPIGKTAERFVIPASVKSIAKGAFCFCSLTEIILPEGIERIDDEALRACIKLTQIDIPPSVKHIGNRAFESCHALKSAILQEGVTYIGDRAFAYCSSLQPITLPESLAYIGKEAFADNELIATLDLPGSLITIGEKAFDGCDNLTKIHIPKGVASIGYRAFDWCISLQSIAVDPLNKEYSSIDGVLYNKAQTKLIACPIDKQGYTFAIPQGVLAIEDYAFYECKLFEISIPESVAQIGKYAFNSCLSLTDLYIPAGVTSVGIQAFSFCDSLESISVSLDNPSFTSQDGILYDKAITELIAYPPTKSDTTDFTVPATVKRIGDMAFGNNKTLQKIRLPDGLETIGVNAFSSCNSLTGLSIPDSVVSIGICAFTGSANITHIRLPAGIKEIGDGTFFYCTSLKTISIPQGVTRIAQEGFFKCESLESIILPEGVTTIDNYAFAHCSKLTSIVIPGSVTSIDTDAFHDCPLLTISGIPGSAAQTYAQENGIPFQAM